MSKLTSSPQCIVIELRLIPKFIDMYFNITSRVLLVYNTIHHIQEICLSYLIIDLDLIVLAKGGSKLEATTTVPARIPQVLKTSTNSLLKHSEQYFN